MASKNNPHFLERLLYFMAGILSPALQVQLSLALCFLICLPVSYFYRAQNRLDLVQENPNLILIGLGLSLSCFLVGNFLHQTISIRKHINLQRGAWIVLVSWLIACSISATVYFLAGFPDPQNVESMTVFRRLVDSYYESVSGFGTAGTSILKSVEIFPKSLLLWRTLTQFIGGMGIAYLAITLLKHFAVSRAEIINSEVESPNQMEFESEEEARVSGWRFLVVYCSFSMVACGLLYISGIFFRATPYQNWYDNLYDSVNFALSAVATGGFSVYDTGVGLPLAGGGPGGLQNTSSEWILAVFMLLGGTNFVLWFGVLFEGKVQTLFKNLELKSYLSFIFILTVTIWGILAKNNFASTGDDLRYAFFNVVTVVSSTGLVNQDFTKWPIEAQGLLFSGYLVGGCVGSTAGGLKFERFLVMLKYAWIQTRNLIFGRNQTFFSIGGATYSDRSSGIILLNMILYFSIIMIGSIILLLTNTTIHLIDGSIVQTTLETALTASIANLGGIGPAAFGGVAQSGPVGNYFAFSEISKIVMMGLIFIGRIGVLSILMLFITQRGQYKLRSGTTLADVEV